MKIINDHLSSAFPSSFPACNTEDRRTGEKKKQRKTKKRSALEVKKGERHKICSTL